MTNIELPQSATCKPRALLVGMGDFQLDPGGLNRYFADLRGALQPSMTVVDVVVAPQQGASGPQIGTGEDSAWLPVRLLRLRTALRDLASAGIDVDLVNTHFALYALPARTVASFRKLPHVVNFQGPWSQEARTEGRGGTLLYRTRRGIERSVYKTADEAIVLSAAFKDVLVQEFGVLPDRVHILRPGVDLDHFQPGESSAVRTRLGLPMEVSIALTVRRLATRMGLDVLIEAWGRLDAGLLLIVGSGDQHRSLATLAADLGLGENRLRFLGRQPDSVLADLYRAADVTVVPSLSLEGFGLVVLESLAAGTPVIASNTGGMAEVLPDLRPDLLVPPGDVAALAARLRRAFDQPTSLPATRDCRTFAERFAWPTVADQVLDVFAQACARPPQRKTRVVYLVHSAQLSGGELALVRLLEALEDVAPHVVLGEDGPLARLLATKDIDHEVLRLPDAAHVPRAGAGARAAVATGVYVLRLTHRLRQLRPDVVHCNTLKANLYGPPAARLAGVPVVWHARDRVDPEYLPRPVVALVRAAARVLPSVVIANSRSTLASLHLPPSRKSYVVPSPVPLPAPPEPRDADPLVLVAVGRLAAWKGQHVALRAFAQAFPTGQERLQVVGDALFGESAYAEDLRRLASTSGVAERVDFLGHIDDVQRVLRDADVLVHSSIIPEPFGNVVVEGMAAGLAVVASDAGGPREIVTPGHDGLLTPLGDVEALAAALRRLADDPALRQRLADNARGSVSRYSPKAVAQDVSAIYLSLLGADHSSEMASPRCAG